MIPLPRHSLHRTSDLSLHRPVQQRVFGDIAATAQTAQRGVHIPGGHLGQLDDERDGEGGLLGSRHVVQVQLEARHADNTTCKILK